LVVAPTEKAVDQVLDLFIKTKSPFKIIRLGKSNTRDDLNEKFQIKLSSKAENDKGIRIQET
jgi:hypothetical protein